VAVVGGGPAGMEAPESRLSGGHEVILYEKEPKLGGLLSLAAMIKGTEWRIFRRLPDTWKGRFADSA